MENQHGNDERNRILADRLRDIIFLESSKPDDEKDIDLIKECVDFLMEIEGKEKITQEQIDSAFANIFGTAESNIVNIRKPTRSLKMILVAACLACAMLIANFTAMAFGVDTTSILREFGSRIVEMFAGDSEEFKDVTIIKRGTSFKYDSFDEFLEEENLNILYPTKLPKDLTVSNVIITESDNQKNSDYNYKQISYTTDNNDIGITVYTSTDIPDSFSENEACQVKDINGFRCYILNIDDTFVQCEFVYKNCLYFVSGNIATMILQL